MCGGQFYATWQRFASEFPFGRYAEQTSQTHEIQIYLGIPHMVLFSLFPQSEISSLRATDNYPEPV